MNEAADGAWWWPFLFITLAGVLPTAIWRWLGVGLVAGLDDESELFVLVRCMAASFVAVVIAQFVFFPTGALAVTPLWCRVAALVAGLAAFLAARQAIWAGVLAGEAVLLALMIATDTVP